MTSPAAAFPVTIRAPLGPRCLNLAGRLSLPVMVAVVGRLSLLVTNDSGAAHMAYATGTPSVTIFGGTEASRWGPRRGPRHRALFHVVPCRPCQGDSCPAGFACLEAIGPSDAVEAVRELGVWNFLLFCSDLLLPNFLRLVRLFNGRFTAVPAPA